MARYIDKDQVIEWIKQRLLPTVTYEAKEIVINSVKRIVKVEDAENWLQHNQTAYQLAMDVALNAYYQAKNEETEKFKEKVFRQIQNLF